MQEILSDIPSLLQYGDDPKLSFVKTELVLPDSGKADILFIDSSGLPIIVEVKLERNAESRREIVAQIFDYTSSITQYTVDELNDLSEQHLQNAIKEVANTDEDEDKIWKHCGTNLRAGNVRVVLAIDKAPEELIRIVRYVNDHSDLDVRLVEFKKFSDQNKKSIFVPNFIVHGERKTIVKEKRSKGVPDADFQDIINKYDEIAEKGYKTRGRAINYRQIRNPQWPTQLHYEILNAGDEFSNEIHIESDRVVKLSETLIRFSKKLSTDFTDCQIGWDPKWSKNRGRLYIRYPKSTAPKILAESMKKLIDKTNLDITKELEKSGII